MVTPCEPRLASLEMLSVVESVADTKATVSPPPLLVVCRRRCGDGSDRTVGTVVFDGELDAYSTSCVRDSCFHVLDEVDELHIDLDAVTFVDCAGLRFLERCYERLDRRSARCEFHRSSLAVRRIVELVDSAGIRHLTHAGFLEALGKP